MSPLASGLGSQFGLKKEATYGVQLAATGFYEIDSAALALDQSYQDGVGLRAGRMFAPSGRQRQTTRQAGGAIPMDVPTKGFGAILDLMHGLVPTVVQQAATAAWKQTHLIGTSMPDKSATLQVNKPLAAATDVATTYPGSIPTAIAFAMEATGILKCTVTWDCMDERTLTTTPAGLALAVASYPTGVTSWVGTIGSVVTLNGTPAGKVRSMALNWAQPYKTDRFFLGSVATKLKPIPNGLQTTSGTMEIEWFDTAAYDLFRSGAKVALVFSFTNDVIATIYSENITFTLSAIQVRGESPAIQGPDVLEQSVAFVAGDNGVAAPLTIEYMSTDTIV